MCSHHHLHRLAAECGCPGGGGTRTRTCRKRNGVVGGLQQCSPLNGGDRQSRPLPIRSPPLPHLYRGPMPNYPLHLERSARSPRLSECVPAFCDRDRCVWQSTTHLTRPGLPSLISSLPLLFSFTLLAFLLVKPHHFRPVASFLRACVSPRPRGWSKERSLHTEILSAKTDNLTPPA